MMTRLKLQLRAVIILLCAACSDCFGTTDLLAVLSEAEDRDPFYREAQTLAAAAAESIPQARADLWFPRINFDAGASEVRQDIDNPSRFGAGGIVSFSTHNYRINAEQPIYHHDRYVALKQADKRLQQAQLEVLAAHQDLMVRVAERYFDVLAAEDNLAFAIAEKQSLQGQLEQAQQRFDVGLIAITDVQEAQAGFDRALASEISARNAIENAHEALREITSSYHPALTPLGGEMPLVSPVPEDIDTWTETALDNNLELSAAWVETEIAQTEIKRQFSGHLPSIDVVGGHGFNKQGGRFGSTKVDQSDIGVRLQIPIFEGGRVSSATREAEHRHQAALERLEQTRRSVQRRTRQAFLGIQSHISSVNALNQAVLSSRTALDSTRAGFEVGTRTAIDVIAAERGLSQAKRDYARARYDYIVEMLRLKQAAGSLSPQDLGSANAWLTSANLQEPATAEDQQK